MFPGSDVWKRRFNPLTFWGVIIDSEEVWEEVRRGYVAEFGKQFRPDSQDRMMGMNTQEWSRHLAEEVGVPRTPEQVANIRRGAYTLIDSGGTPECIVIATGSEVGIAAEAVNKLNSAGARVRLVSMPSLRRNAKSLRRLSRRSCVASRRSKSSF